MADPLHGATLHARATLALAVPLQAALGVALIDDDDPSVGVWFTVGDLADNSAGSAHAAALAAALEVAGYLALLPALAEDEHAVTHAFSSRLIGAAPVGEPVDVRGGLNRRTRRTAFLTATAALRSNGQIVADAQLTKTVVAWGHRPESAEPG